MHQKQTLLLALYFAISLSGCDFVDSAKDSFSTKEKSAPKAAQSASQTSPHSDISNKTMAMPIDVLVRIGSWTLTKKEFEERLLALKEVVPDYDVSDPAARKLVLEELIRQQLIVMDAEKTGLAAQKDIVAAVDEFRRTLIVREAARKLTENVRVTDEEAMSFYKENEDQIIEPFQYRISEIVVDDEVKANELYVALLKGADFAETAKLHSKGKTAEKGGDLGFLTEDPFPAMVDAVLSIDEGKVSKVFEGPDGFYIVRLDEKKGGMKISFDEVKEDIVQNRTLFKQQQAILNYINDLQKTMNVEVNGEFLKR